MCNLAKLFFSSQNWHILRLNVSPSGAFIAHMFFPSSEFGQCWSVGGERFTALIAMWKPARIQSLASPLPDILKSVKPIFDNSYQISKQAFILIWRIMPYQLSISGPKNVGVGAGATASDCPRLLSRQPLPSSQLIVAAGREVTGFWTARLVPADSTSASLIKSRVQI